MKMKDPSCIVIDEIVAFLALLIYLQPDVVTLFYCFLLFRFFDILKPFPINILEKKFEGSFIFMMRQVLFDT